MATTTLSQLHQALLPSPAATAVFGGSDRLSQEIFSILESKFLFGAPPELGASSAGRVRVLSIDGGADGGALAAAALVRLERRLQELSGNSDARVADFFDLAAGSGAGGFLAAALFARRIPAEAARDVVMKNRKVLAGRGGRGGLFRRPEAVFKKVFGDLTVRDAAKPLLIPCYDMATAAPFVFSRADAVEAEAFDFPLWQVCAAACGMGPAEVASLDGRTRLRAVAALGGGGASAAVANPTAVAVTHVLHNKREFPFAAGAGDLVVLSLGGSVGASALRPSSSSLLRIAGACQADMVDQAVSMAFGESRATNYIRIQGNGIAPGETSALAFLETLKKKKGSGSTPGASLPHRCRSFVCILYLFELQKMTNSATSLFQETDRLDTTHREVAMALTSLQFIFISSTKPTGQLTRARPHAVNPLTPVGRVNGVTAPATRVTLSFNNWLLSLLSFGEASS